jgi:hypothetical protein
MLTLVHSIVSVLVLLADSVAGRFWNLKSLPCAISYTFFVGSVRADRSFALGLALPIMAALSGSDGVGQAGNGDPLAPSRISALLALALKVRTSIGRSRSS